MIPPALRGTHGPLPPCAGGARLARVVLTLDPHQEAELLRGATGIVNRAVVHLHYDDGTVISHFTSPDDARKAARAITEREPCQYEPPETGI